MDPDDMQYIEINLFDHDIKGQGHSDVILLNKMTERFLSQYPVPPYFACKCSNKEKSAK
jgi:hypothetical protein